MRAMLTQTITAGLHVIPDLFFDFVRALPSSQLFSISSDLKTDESAS